MFFGLRTAMMAAVTLLCASCNMFIQRGATKMPANQRESLEQGMESVVRGSIPSRQQVRIAQSQVVTSEDVATRAKAALLLEHAFKMHVITADELKTAFLNAMQSRKNGSVLMPEHLRRSLGLSEAVDPSMYEQVLAHCMHRPAGGFDLSASDWQLVNVMSDSDNAGDRLLIAEVLAGGARLSAKDSVKLRSVLEDLRSRGEQRIGLYIECIDELIRNGSAARIGP